MPLFPPYTYVGRFIATIERGPHGPHLHFTHTYPPQLPVTTGQVGLVIPVQRHTAGALVTKLSFNMLSVPLHEPATEEHFYTQLLAPGQRLIVDHGDDPDCVHQLKEWVRAVVRAAQALHGKGLVA